jgi:hypothetical protein
MVTDPHLMFQRHLEHEGRTRQFLIATHDTGGWDVVEALDRHVVRQVHYDDWHRVERARTVFALQVQSLTDEGWVAIDTPAADGSAVRAAGR